MSVSEDTWPEPAYVIRTERLEIRCYERGDVRALHQEVLDNIDALRPWMPWIEYEPMTLEERGILLRTFRARFDAGEDYVYGVFERDGTRLLGGTGLHTRAGPGALEIGYWIVSDRWGEGLATEVAAAMTRVGFERMHAEKIEIRVSPTNQRSLAVPRKLGYREEGTLRAALPMRPNREALVVFGMLSQELPGTPAAAIDLEIEGFMNHA